MPWILCGPGSPPDSTGEAVGSTAIIRSEGLRAFNAWPTPVMVPPVPTPATTMSTAPSVSFQISSAVVTLWMAGLAAFSNCDGLTAFGVEASSSCARAMAPFMPFSAGVSSSRAPSSASILRRSIDMLSGMHRIRRRPLAAATKASAMPVLPLVGSISTVSASMRPCASSASIIATPMRSLTEATGLKNSSLASTVALAPYSADRRGNRTSGVSPMVSTMES